MFKVNFNFYNFNSRYEEKNRQKLKDYFDSIGIPNPIVVQWNYDDPEIHEQAKETLRKFFEQNHDLNIMEVGSLGIPFSVIGISDGSESFAPRVANQLNKILKVISDRHDLKVEGTKAQDVHIHLPNQVSYVGVSEVKILNDCCTESLQRRLDEGWKILAICPQPHQRRPDYVVGKFGEKVEQPKWVSNIDDSLPY